MKTTKIPCLLALLIWLFIPTVATAFNCENAATQVEITICAVPELKKLEADMLGLHKKLAARNILFSPSQKDWRDNQRDKCNDNVACIQSVYAARIGYFNALLATTVPLPATVNPPPATSMPEEFAEAVESSQVILQAKPAPVNPVTPPTIAQVPAPVTKSAAATIQPAQNQATQKPAIKPAPPPEQPPLISGQTLKHFFLWLVFFAALFGLYKASRLPEAQKLLNSSLFKLRTSPEYTVQGRRLSLLRLFLIILPVVVLTLWLLYNVIDVIAAGSGSDPFHTQPVCSLPQQPTSFSIYELNRYQTEAQDYIAQHPECAPQVNQSGGRSRFMDMVESKGFLIPYYFWALPFALYLNYRLFLKRTPLDLKGLVWVFFVLSMAFSPVPLSLLWPLLPGLPKTPGWMTFLLIVPVPPLVMLTFGTAAITVFFGGIFSLISAIALPIVALFNQINTFLITRKRQELQATGVYIWLVEFEHWLTGTPMPQLPPDDSKGARFATPQEIASIMAPPSFEKGEVRP
jgi:uncharacterized protein